jgi:hypothetical protein
MSRSSNSYINLPLATALCNYIFSIRFSADRFEAVAFLRLTFMICPDEKTMKSKGVKKHLSATGDAPVRYDDMVYACKHSTCSGQFARHCGRVVPCSIKAAHLTGLLHVHLHIITSNLRII